jgi:uncharacterized membrane protein (DUF2068 family)
MASTGNRQDPISSFDHMPPSLESRHEKSSFALVAIGIFKLVKCTLLAALGIALVHWRNQDVGEVASHWINKLWIGRPFVDRMISKLSSLDERTLEEVAAGSFIYSALLLVEGIGLCRRKRWAEFLTVGITGSLLPVEFYELFHHLTTAGVIITLVNVGIMWYLVVQLRHDRRKGSNLP